MLSPDDLSAAVLTKLKAYAPLVAALTSADRVKESQWHGIEFDYPAVRVQRPTISPYGNGNCTGRQVRAQVTVTAFAKKDSSKTAQELQGLIQDALEGQIVNVAGLRTTSLRNQLTSPAAPTPNDPDVWSGATTWRTIATEVS